MYNNELDRIYSVEIDIDPNQAHRVAKKIKFSTNDRNTSVINFQFKKNSFPVNLTGMTLMLHIVKPDFNVSLETIEILDAEAGFATIQLRNDSVQTFGLYNCEIRMQLGNEVSTSIPLQYEVFQTMMNDEFVETSDNFSALADIIEDAQKVLNTENTRKANEQTRINNENVRIANEKIRLEQEENREEKMDEYEERFDAMVAGGTTNQEVIDAREGSPTLVKRLNKGGTPTYGTVSGVNNLTINDTFHSKSDVLLEGQTLVNVLTDKSKSSFAFVADAQYVGVTITPGSVNFKADTIYTVIFNVKTNTSNARLSFNTAYANGTGANHPGGYEIGETGYRIFKINVTPANITHWRYWWFEVNDYTVTTPTGNVSGEIVILEGDYTNKPLPTYFEGLKSAGQTNANKIEVLAVGENLFGSFFTTSTTYKNIKINRLTPNSFNFNATNHGNYPAFDLLTGVGVNQIMGSNIIDVAYWQTKRMIKGTGSYTFQYKQTLNSGSNPTQTIALIYDDVKFTTFTPNQIRTINVASHINGICVDFWYAGGTYDVVLYDLTLVKGTTAKPYTPYVSNKTDILNRVGRSTPNGTRDIFEVKDGKCAVTQNCKETIFNGTESGIVVDSTPNQTNTICFAIPITDRKLISSRDNMLTDKFKTLGVNFANDDEGIFGYTGGAGVVIRILRSKLTTQDVAGFKSWLASNPVTIVYELAVPIKEEFLLNSPSTFTGQTNFFVDGGAIPTPFNVTYDTNVAAQTEKLVKRIEFVEKLLDSGKPVVYDKVTGKYHELVLINEAVDTTNLKNV